MSSIKITILLFCLGLSQFVNSQTCLHTNLSAQFNIETCCKRITVDSCVISIIIKNKHSDVSIDSIQFHSIYLLKNVLMDCTSVRSYQTHINDTIKTVDNDYGDLIVADFNFDGRDDIAVVKDSGGNGGPLYNYFIQDKNGKLCFDKFLSKKMEYFPAKINRKDKLLITYVHAGVCWLSESVYSYNQTYNRWSKKRHRMIDVCKK